MSRRLLAPLLAVAALLLTASPAEAASATTWGFGCSSSGHWVRQDWPDIHTNTSTNENVWFDSDLYRWNGSQWVFWQSTGWMGGVSNNQGRKALGYFAGSPYYFLYGTTRSIPPTTGWVFTQLPAGFYRTAEYYSTASGQSWSTWSHVESTASTWCQV